jgi:hypothetical protein
MNVLLQNPAILLVLVVLATRLIGKRLAAGRKAAAAAEPTAATAEEAERTRRVQEDVARKIAERRRAAAPPAAPRAPVAARPAVEVPPARSYAEVDLAGVLAQQQKLVDQMRVLEGVQAPARSAGGGSFSIPAPAASGGALPELADGPGARRAIVLREVLGPPRGLTLEGCLWR